MVSLIDAPRNNGSERHVAVVRLGNSGLKVSKIILGCMSYGTPEWQKWVLGEEEALEHIKYAYDAGINTFDTANVGAIFFNSKVWNPMLIRQRCTRTAFPR